MIDSVPETASSLDSQPQATTHRIPDASAPGREDMGSCPALLARFGISDLLIALLFEEYDEAAVKTTSTGVFWYQKNRQHVNAPSSRTSATAKEQEQGQQRK
ncbi:MAG TPA: hypothetical protein PKG77_01670 [Phycisphaerae bacterium]|nr:hypothetical protein [Phycisphaerae bacterium]HQL74489.1 hypothetical protein [Phycisphaerae bacterium]